MNAPQPANTAALRALRGDLAAAQDVQIAKVVAILDQLPQRGRADDLLAPLRRRLARIRPLRPLSFDRLLFTPFDRLILPGGIWKRGQPGIPRTALRPLADQIRRARPEFARDIDAMLAGHHADERELVASAGALLWPAAATLLMGATAPANWTETTGLRETEHASLAHAVASLLAAIPDLGALEQAHQAGERPPAEPMARLLRAIDGARPLAAIMLLVMLTEAAPNFAAADRDPQRNLAREQAVDFVIDRLDAQAPLPKALDAAAADICRTADLLENLEARSQERPTRLARIKRARDRADLDCRASFSDALAEHMLAPLDELLRAGDPGIEQLEFTAQSLRRLDHAARRIGGASHYDRALQACAPQLRPRNDDPPATRIDRIRLMEILLGSEVAWQELTKTG